MARKWHQMKPATFAKEWERIKGTQEMPVTQAIESAISRELARHQTPVKPAKRGK